MVFSFVAFLSIPYSNRFSRNQTKEARSVEKKHYFVKNKMKYCRFFFHDEITVVASKVQLGTVAKLKFVPQRWNIESMSAWLCLERSTWYLKRASYKWMLQNAAMICYCWMDESGSWTVVRFHFPPLFPSNECRWRLKMWQSVDLRDLWHMCWNV